MRRLVESLVRREIEVAAPLAAGPRVPGAGSTRRVLAPT